MKQKEETFTAYYICAMLLRMANKIYDNDYKQVRTDFQQSNKKLNYHAMIIITIIKNYKYFYHNTSCNNIKLQF